MQQLLLWMRTGFLPLRAAELPVWVHEAPGSVDFRVNLEVVQTVSNFEASGMDEFRWLHKRMQRGGSA
jgi:hypothetical protein